MATQLDPVRLTAEEFLRIDFGPDKKAELVDGFVRMMTGGTRMHSRVQTRLILFLGNALKGSPGQPHGSDMGVWVNDSVIRYPDVSVYCGKDASSEHDGDLAGTDPRVLIEILSPSTERHDQRDKLADYQSLASVETIAFVDPAGELIRSFQRIGENGWQDSGLTKQDSLELPTLGVSIPATDIFSRS